MSDQTDITLAQPAALAAPKPQFDLSPQTFEQALTLSKYLAESDMVPKDFKGKPGNCLVAMQWGAEVGLKPLQAMQNIAVINGRPSLWGDAVLALVMSSPVCKDVIERYEGEGEDYRAVCIAQRHGRADKMATFSVRDAKAAALLGKQGPWQQYRDRMLKLRARAFALRDQFPDILKGLPVAEEVMDTPTETHMGAADVVQPEKEVYPDEKFRENLPKWHARIDAGQRSADDIIAMVETKNRLTEQQKKEIRAEAVKPAPARTTRAAPAAEAKPQQQPQREQAAEPQPGADTGAIVMTYAQVNQRLVKAQNLDELAEAGDLIGAVENPEHRSELTAVYDERQAALSI